MMWWATINPSEKKNRFFFTFSFHSLSRGVGFIFVVLLISCDVCPCAVGQVCASVSASANARTRGRERRHTAQCFDTKKLWPSSDIVSHFMGMCLCVFWYFVSRLYRILIGFRVLCGACCCCCWIVFFRILCSWLCFDWFLLCLSFGIHALCVVFFFSRSLALSSLLLLSFLLLLFLFSFFSFIFHPFFLMNLACFMWI